MIPEQVLEQIEPFYFLDYALFTGSVRQQAARSLEDVFKQDSNFIHRKLHTLNIYKEEFAAYEDVGAFLKAIIEYRRKNSELLLSNLLTYNPKHVLLSKLFDYYGISSELDLVDELRMDEWIPAQWHEWFPNLNLDHTLRTSCKFFFEDCKNNQQEYGNVAYNKIKHGLMIIPSGRQYLPELPDQPCVFFHTSSTKPNAQTNPITMMALNSTDERLEQRYRVIEFIQCNLRLIAALYVVWRYPDKLAQRGIQSPKEIFDGWQFTGIREFIVQFNK